MSERKCPHCSGDLSRYEDPAAVELLARSDAALIAQRKTLTAESDTLIAELKTAREGMRAENERVAAESKQCHEQNDRLVKEHLELRERIKGLCKLIDRAATYLCTAGDNDERVIFSAPMPPEFLERLSIAATTYIYPKVDANSK